jgi:hypothetical protein
MLIPDVAYLSATIVGIDTTRNEVTVWLRKRCERRTLALPDGELGAAIKAHCAQGVEGVEVQVQVLMVATLQPRKHLYEAIVGINEARVVPKKKSLL